MMTNRFAYVITAIITAFLLTACQTAQKSGSGNNTSNDTQTVKGINDWEGQISGKPAPGSYFTNLQIGMSMRQVIDLIGPPNDQGAYVTGKAWIPFYYGSDRYRHELVYKGQGRLIFAGGSGANYYVEPVEKVAFPPQNT